MKPDLLPDLSAARRHLFMLTGRIDPVWAFQWVPDYDKKRQRASARIQHFSDTLRDFQRMQNDGCGIFVAVNKTDGHRRKAENMVAAWNIFLDFDGAPLPDTWPMEPHMVTQTSQGNPVPKYHAWWHIQPTKDLFAWHVLMDVLIARWGCDPKCSITTQVGRLAGFWHQKQQDNPWQVKIVLDNTDVAEVLSLREFAERFDVDLPAMVALARAKQKAGIKIEQPPGGWDAPIDIRRMREYLAEPKSWKTTSDDAVSLYRIACVLRDNGIAPQTCVELITEFCPVSSEHWGEGHVEGKVKNAFAYAKNDAGVRSAHVDFDDDVDYEADYEGFDVPKPHIDF